MWEIYAYQNADSLFGIFNAAATIHGSGDYMAAVAAVALQRVHRGAGGLRLRARAAAVKTKTPVVIEALIPKYGSTVYFDSMAIPKDAVNVENAHLFINYILRPEVHASLTNKVFYANPNTASLKFVKKDVAENKTIFLEPAVAKTMVPAESLPQALRKVQTRTFTNFKAGR